MLWRAARLTKYSNALEYSRITRLSSCPIFRRAGQLLTQLQAPAPIQCRLSRSVKSSRRPASASGHDGLRQPLNRRLVREAHADVQLLPVGQRQNRNEIMHYSGASYLLFCERTCSRTEIERRHEVVGRAGSGRLCCQPVSSLCQPGQTVVATFVAAIYATQSALTSTLVLGTCLRRRLHGRSPSRSLAQARQVAAERWRRHPHGPDFGFCDCRNLEADRVLGHGTCPRCIREE